MPCHAAVMPCPAQPCRTQPTNLLPLMLPAPCLLPPASPVVPGKDRQDQAELALQSYTINPVCKEHMPGMAWAHPHQ